MENIRFCHAATIEDAIVYLKEYSNKAKLLAGGTDLMVQLNAYEIPEDTVFIGIEDIPLLKEIYLDEETIHIGSMVTNEELIKSDIIKCYGYALYQAARESASPQVRNRATIGGNVATASPSGDVQAALIALEASAVIRNEAGERIIPVEKIPLFVKKTCLEATDIIVKFLVPKRKKHQGSCFVKMGKRKAMTISIVNVAANITLSDDNKTIKSAIIAAGACATTVVRLKEYEKSLIGKEIDSEMIEKLSIKALDDVDPITDIRASKWYRKETIQVFAKRAVLGAIENAIKEA